MDTLKDKIAAVGFDNVAEIQTESITFDPTLIKHCEMNSCGKYGKNYTCPPNIGDPEELIEIAKSYKKTVVFQKIYDIEDSFDFEGMNRAQLDFKELTLKVQSLCESVFDDFLLLGAGPCELCKVCGIADGIECRFPKKAIASLESYSIFVTSLATTCNMNYINGVNTVTYFGAMLYNEF